MNKRILVSESEKNSILKMHESFKNRYTIKEEDSSDMTSSKGVLLKNITRIDGLSNDIIKNIKTEGNRFAVTAADQQITLNGKPSYHNAIVTPDTTIGGSPGGLINVSGKGGNFAIGYDFDGPYIANEA